jgi:hypothetical protein
MEQDMEQGQPGKVCFKRLVQAGVNTIVTEESRVWEFVGSRWKLGSNPQWPSMAKPNSRQSPIKIEVDSC